MTLIAAEKYLSSPFPVNTIWSRGLKFLQFRIKFFFVFFFWLSFDTLKTKTKPHTEKPDTILAICIIQSEIFS